MKYRLAARVVACVALAASSALPVAASSATSSGHRAVSPQSAIGPRAEPFDAAGPAFGLFTCQVGLTPFVCYDPYQMRKAYGTDKLIGAGYTGAGRTIVIIDAFQAPTLASDLATFDDFYGLPAANLVQIAPFGTVPFDPADPNMQGWWGEITLDVEWAHAIAPDARIVLVLAKTNEDSDILNAIKYAVDNNLGDVISMSFGENESCADPSGVAAYHDVFAQATQKGITLFASSGDQGAAQQTCDGASWTRAASHPATDPLVSGVGGTELHAAGYCLTSLKCDPTKNPAAGTYQGEIVWNEDLALATGGGVSVLFDAPPYQKSAVAAPGRGVPDVAYSAATGHGVLTYWAGDWFLFGGTSAGSPQWAGILAIANQVAGKRLGYLNKAFYQIRQTPPNYSASFHDITSGNNSVIETDANGNDVVVGGFVAGSAWDATTGIGSPRTDGIVGRLVRLVSPGDAVSAIATSKPHAHGKPPHPGAVTPH